MQVLDSGGACERACGWEGRHTHPPRSQSQPYTGPTHLGDAKVTQHKPTVAQQEDVLCLDVTMQHLAAVHVVDAKRDLGQGEGAGEVRGACVAGEALKPGRKRRGRGVGRADGTPTTAAGRWEGWKSSASRAIGDNQQE